MNDSGWKNMPSQASRQVFCVSLLYPHHASKSGYDRLADYLGQRIELNGWIGQKRDTLLRAPSKLASLCSGMHEYSRRDAAGEVNALLHMLRHRDSIYHFLYGEKSFRFSGGMNKRRGNRIVATFHHPPQMYPVHFRSTGHLRALAHAIVVSTNQLEYMEAILGKGRVTFVPHGVDTAYWSPIQRAPTEQRRLVFAGTHMRDFHTLRQVIRRVLEARADVEFVLMSSNQQCEGIATQKGVRWLRGVPDEQYRHELAGADLLVLPLLHSTAVNSVLEALACGVPVVTTRGGISDYLDDSCSAQFNRGDVDSMSDCVLSLLSDGPRLDAMRAAARQHALKFDWSLVSATMSKVYWGLN